MGAGQYKSESTSGNEPIAGSFPRNWESNSITNKNPGPRPVKDKITDSRQLKYSSSRDDVDCVGALEKGRVCKSRQDLRPTDQEVDCGLYCWWTEYYSKRLDDVVRMCSEEMQPQLRQPWLWEKDDVRYCLKEAIGRSRRHTKL